MNKIIKTCCVIITLTIPFFTGCKHRSQNLTQNFGKSYKKSFGQQIINPDAPVDHSPVESLPGSLGNQIYRKRYVKSLTEEKKNDESLSQELSDMD